MHDHSFLLSPSRKNFEDPDKFLPFLINENDTVADLGCGPGYYCQFLVKFTKNKIYCVDKNEEFITEAKRIVKSNNVIFLVEDSSHTSIPSSSIDKVIFANSFHDMENKEKTYEEVVRILKPNGKIIIIDWKKENTPFGPPIRIRMSKEDYLKIFRDFKLEKEFYVGPYHQGLVLGK
jgi:ubiquinone/menaquinone biosynthesis C-methylase UbiE